MKDLNEILKMANDVQEQLASAQENLDKLEVEGTSGGGLVKVKASARGRIISIDLDPSLFEANSKELTEDLIIAALHDARSRADVTAHKEMKRVTAGMPLPPGFKL